MNLLQTNEQDIFVYESLEDDPQKNSKSTRKDPDRDCSCVNIEKACKSERCIRRTDCVGSIAFVCVVLGVIILLVGYLVPRHPKGDPETDEYKQLENYYTKLGHGADVSILVALGFISVGGIIMAGLFMWSAIEGCRQKDADDGGVPLINKLPVEAKLLPTEDAEMDYGTSS
ncbi:uncharacterized protein LOC100369025 [Saccoglossus kowalevskii]|uniref:Uncharacterized protein LOC100369025 n=1 Tax=Saccoglossus kowalevskii TaxID=10224 RepID=A0ABM0GN61_SACKO|nr:PREDICTED: uncharacterized protein LOC100369025 [Saccoglossus kowalevskii]